MSLFYQTGTNIQEHLDSITTSTQPYLLAVGRRKKAVHQFFIILDKNAISCRSASSLGAFNELFKAHYVFATTYSPMLYNLFMFIQTTVFNIDVGKVKESPRVAEVRLGCFISTRTNLFDTKCFVCQTELTCANTLVRHLPVVHGYFDGKNFALNVLRLDVAVCLELFLGLGNI